MDSYLSLPYEHETPRPEDADEVRTPPALVERFLREHTEPGDRVLDPFAGFGTTLAVAARLDREPYGLEYEPERVAFVRDRLADFDLDRDERVRQGSVLDLEPDAVPTIDYVFTSPPFTVRGLDGNPFENYEGDATYDSYLDDVATAFERVAAVLAPDAQVTIDVANVAHEGEVTTLAWDVADRVRETLHFDGEVVVTWTGEGNPHTEGSFGYGYDHSYCLAFSNVDE